MWLIEVERSLKPSLFFETMKEHELYINTKKKKKKNTYDGGCKKHGEWPWNAFYSTIAPIIPLQVNLKTDDHTSLHDSSFTKHATFSVSCFLLRKDQYFPFSSSTERHNVLQLKQLQQFDISYVIHLSAFEWKLLPTTHHVIRISN